MIVLDFDHRDRRRAMSLLRPLGLHKGGHRVSCDTLGLDRADQEELKRAYPGVIRRNAPASGEFTPARIAKLGGRR
jgi:hypothetical protein